jgi:hypothetical protein
MSGPQDNTESRAGERGLQLRRRRRRRSRGPGCGDQGALLTNLHARGGFETAPDVL